MPTKTDWSDTAQKNTLWKKGIKDQGFLGLEVFKVGQIEYLVVPDGMQLAKVNDNLFIIQEKETFEEKVMKAVQEYSYEHRHNHDGGFNVPEVARKIIERFKGIL